MIRLLKTLVGPPQGGGLRLKIIDLELLVCYYADDITLLQERS